MEFVQKMVTERSFDARGALIPEGQIGTFDVDRLNGKEPHIHDVGDIAIVQVEQSAISPSGPNPTVPQQIPPDAVQGPGGGYFRPGVQLVAERTLDADARLAGRLQDGDTSEGDLVAELRRMEARTGEIRALLNRDREARESAHRTALASVGAATAPPAPTMAELMDTKSAEDSDEVKALKAEIERLKADKTPVPAPGAPTVDVGSNVDQNTVADVGSNVDRGAGDDTLVEGTVKTVTADLGTKTDDQLNAMLKAENGRETPRVGVTNAIEAELDKRKQAAQS